MGHFVFVALNRSLDLFQDFVDGAEKAHTLDPVVIRQHAMNNYSMPVIARRYQRYFERLSTLWGDGWYHRRAVA